MCFRKRENVDEKFFLYLCEEYFENGKHSEYNDDYDSIIIDAAMEIYPEENSNSKKFTWEELQDICKKLVVKTLLLLYLQEDRKNKLTSLIVEKYPGEVEKILKKSLVDSLYQKS